MTMQIPTFKLYGEQIDWPTPDLLHWESISSRSRLHQWKIKPHRHGNLLQLIYLQSGSAAINLDGTVRTVGAATLVVIPPLSVHSFAFSPEAEGHVLTLASPLISALTTSLGSDQVLLHGGRIIADSHNELPPLLSALAKEYRGQAPYRDWALETLVSQIVLWLARHPAESAEAVKGRDKSRQHFTRFQELIETRYCEHLPMTAYAEELGISLAHLNSICRRLADRSALQLLHERLLLEAKRDLVYTAMSVSDIADKLGFSEPAYFTRFFKRLTGSSPQQFRLLKNGPAEAGPEARHGQQAANK